MRDDERLLYSFIEYLLPAPNGDRAAHLRPEGSSGPAQRHWDELWTKFRADGKMFWPDFELFLRQEPKIAVAGKRIFDLLDDTGSGYVTTRSLLEVRRQYEKMRLYKHNSLQDLRKYLVARCGSLMKSWRNEFDPDSKGSCGHNYFVKTCGKLGFSGDLKQTWFELVGGESRPCTVKDLDPEGDVLVSQFALALKNNHGTVRDGWFSLLKAHGRRGYAAQKDFEVVCASMGFNAKTASKLFSYLDKNGDKSVSMDEWMFLSQWERRALETGFVGSVGGYLQTSAAPAVKGRSRSNTGLSKTSGGNFEFTVIMSDEEHEDYLRRLRQAYGDQGAETGRSTKPSPVSPRLLDDSSGLSPRNWGQPVPTTPPGPSNQASLAGLLQQMAASQA